MYFFFIEGPCAEVKVQVRSTGLVACGPPTRATLHSACRPIVLLNPVSMPQLLGIAQAEGNPQVFLDHAPTDRLSGSGHFTGVYPRIAFVAFIGVDICRC